MASIEWLVTEKCNFNCSYCGLYNNLKKPELNLNEIKKFLIKLKLLQEKKKLEFFLFGGETFLHPKIKDILFLLKKYNIFYKTQTNLSTYSTNKIIEISKTIKISKITVSVHFEQQSLEEYIKNINSLIQNNVKINEIQIMFKDESVLDKFETLKNIFKDQHVIMYAVSDFLVQGFGDSLKKFNELKKLNPENFENIIVTHPETKKQIQRSIIWEEFIDKKLSPKNNICLLKDNFLMFDSQLKIYNCCFHEFIEDSICKFDTCFMS